MDETTVKKRRVLFMNLCLFCITIGGIIVALEIFFRFFLPQDLIEPMAAQLDPEIIYTLTPNTESYLKGTSAKLFHLKTNSLGLREKEILPDKPSGTYRIMLLGDSMSMAEGVEVEDIYLKQLDVMLKQRGRNNVETINAAIRGYGNDQELVLFRRLETRIKPDMVLLAFYTGNDFDDNWNGQLFSLDHGRLIHRRVNPDLSKKYRYYSLQSRLQNIPGYSFVLSRSHAANWLRVVVAKIIYNRIYRDKKKNPAEPLLLPSDEKHPGFELTLAILTQWQREVANAGALPCIMIIPHREMLRDVQEDAGQGVSRSDIAIENYCAGKKIMCLNLTHALLATTHHENLWLKCGHLNEEGHAFVAAELLKFFNAHNGISD